VRGIELLVLVSALCFAGSSAAVGIRLLRIGQRTQGTPERIVGFSLFVLGAIAWPLLMVVGAPQPAPAPVLRAAAVVSNVAMGLGWSGVFVFTWHVFRPAEPWARMLAGAGVGLELGAGAAAVVRALVLPDADALRIPSVPGLLILGGAMLSHGWSALEAFRYHALLRRRIPLGLADPLVADRFRLWGWISVSAIGAIAPSTVSVFLGASPHTTFNYGVVAVCGLVCSGTLTLAFLPPAAYVRYVRGAASEMSPADAG